MPRASSFLMSPQWLEPLQFLQSVPLKSVCPPKSARRPFKNGFERRFKRLPRTCSKPFFARVTLETLLEEPSFSSASPSNSCEELTGGHSHPMSVRNTPWQGSRQPFLGDAASFPCQTSSRRPLARCHSCPTSTESTCRSFPEEP